MKKRNIKSLKLKKSSISNLNLEVYKGGEFTTGCSDGCTPFQTAYRCTLLNCSNDCDAGSNIPFVCGSKE